MTGFLSGAALTTSRPDKRGTDSCLVQVGKRLLLHQLLTLKTMPSSQASVRVLGNQQAVTSPHRTGRQV
jgi:hypothetical protein